jgi:tetratricopeptide (TPR) repeat protein
MPVRHGWLLVPILCLSCTALRLPESVGGAAGSGRNGQAAQDTAAPPESVPAAREATWLPAPANPLRLAATCLDEGKLGEASGHLARYLDDHPDQALIRSRYADLLARLRRLPEARAQYERAVADSPEEGPAAVRILVHCHRRLMEIAAAHDDDYGEHLHRGIGLYLLARQREQIGGTDDELPAESLLCKAAAELTLAQLQRTAEARPAWYLYRVWVQLGQHQAAQRSLRDTLDAFPFTSLTPAEQRGLYAVQQQQRTESERH